MQISDYMNKMNKMKKKNYEIIITIKYSPNQSKSPCICGKNINDESDYPCQNSRHVYCQHCKNKIKKMEEVMKKTQKRFESLKKLFPDCVK